MLEERGRACGEPSRRRWPGGPRRRRGLATGADETDRAGLIVVMEQVLELMGSQPGLGQEQPEPERHRREPRPDREVGPGAPSASIGSS